MKYLTVLAFALFIVHSIFAIEPKPSVMDTIMLDEVTTYADYRRYQPGAKIDELNTVQIEAGQYGNINNLLSRFTPIYVKGNAGGLSTIRVRGTASSHTTVNFGGININSLTLGQTNASTIPTFLFDKLDVQYGNSSAINGSGALGGTIYLEQNNQWTNGLNAKLHYSNGTYGEHLSGAKIYVGNGRFESVSKIFAYRNKNNFSFENPYHADRFINKEPITDTQKGAEIHNSGFLQELNYKFTPNEYFKSMVWLEKSWYQIQPNMQSNLNFVSGPEIENNSIRLWTEYKNENNNLKYQLGAGYVHDEQLYDNIEEQLIITDRLITQASAKQKLFEISEYRIGAKYKYIVPNVYSYSTNNIEFEQHLDLFLSYFIAPTNNLKTTVNLRQSFVTNFNAPFTPSVVAEYNLYSSGISLLSVNGGVSRSYRVPTLNDRYWGDQGNPDLKPEDGFNLEGGLNYIICREQNHYKLKMNLFYMDISNWIEWRNFGVWQAQNVQRVISKGIELQSSAHFDNNNSNTSINFNYSFNPVNRIENHAGAQMEQQQLIYSPMHTANASIFHHYKALTVFSDWTFTGSRYSDYLGIRLPHYVLGNAGIVYPIKYKGHEALINLQVNNILNKQYQNERYYAMPGRVFRMGVSLTFNKLK